MATVRSIVRSPSLSIECFAGSIGGNAMKTHRDWRIESDGATARSVLECGGKQSAMSFPVVHFTDPIVTVVHGTFLGGFDFDASRRRSTWFGGLQIGTHNKIGFFDGREWTLLTNNTPPPAPRVFPAMAYDSDRHVHVMFGGSPAYGAGGGTNDTWELIAMDLPLINEHPASQYRVAGEAATFSV